MVKNKRKPTIKELGKFSVDTYNYVRFLERTVVEIKNTLGMYIEMKDDVANLEKYVKERVEVLKNEAKESTKNTNGKKEQTKGSRTTKTSSKSG